MSNKLYIGLGMLAVEFAPVGLYFLGNLDLDWMKVIGFSVFTIFNIVALILVLAGAFEKDTNKTMEKV